MPQHVIADVLLYFALPDGGLQAASHTVGGYGHGAFPGGKKEYLWPVLEPVDSQLCQRLDRQRNRSISVTFGVARPDDHTLAVNIIEAKIHGLGNSQAARIHQHKTHVRFGTANQIQQTPHLITAQYDRQSLVGL